VTTVDVPIFKDKPDLSTPVDAAHLRAWGLAIKANADAAEAAEAGATAPTDTIMAAKVADAASLFRGAADGIYAPVSKGSAAVAMTALPTFLWNTVEVNNTSFQRDNVVTTATTQYAAWWDSHQNPIIGKRYLSGGPWTTFDLSRITGNPFFAPAPQDGHNVLSVAVDAAGYIHISGNMHDTPLIYVRSTNPWDITAWAAGAMVGTQEASVTYPQFVTMPDNTLLFFYRDGVAGAGNVILNVWNPGPKTWTRRATVLTGAGLTPVQSPYIDQPAVGADGSLHLFAVYRVGASYTGTHDIGHMKSTNNGVTWTSITGAALTLPVAAYGSTGGTGSILPMASPVTAGTVGLINQCGAAVDLAGHPHAADWRQNAVTPTTYELHHVWHDGAAWHDDIEYTLTGTAGSDTRSIARPGVLCPPDGRTLILWRDNFNEPAALYCHDVSAAPIVRVQRFPIALLDLGGAEPSFDYTTARNGALHMLLTPICRNLDQSAGDETWAGQWGAILSVDLSQIADIAAGRIAVPSLDSRKTVVASVTSSVTTRAEAVGIPLPESSAVMVARLVAPSSATVTDGDLRLTQKAMQQTTGVDIGDKAVPVGGPAGLSSFWQPIRPDIEDTTQGVQVMARYSAGAGGTLTVPALAVETARIVVGAKPVAYTAPRSNGSADSWGHLVAFWKVSALGLSNGAAVSSVADISGNGLTISQGTTAMKPTYSPAGINGHPSLQFDGGDVLVTAANATLGNTFTIVTVAASTATPATYQQILSSDDGTAVRAFQVCYGLNAADIEAVSFCNDNTARTAATGTLSPSAATARVITIRRTFSIWGTFLEIWINGVLAGSNSTASNYGRSTPGPIALGARWSGGVIVTPLTGFIGDTIVFDTWLNSAERRAAEARLARVYGITLA